MDASFPIVMRDAIPVVGVHQSTCLINDKLVAQKIKYVCIGKNFLKNHAQFTERRRRHHRHRDIYDASRTCTLAKYTLLYYGGG